MRFDSPITKFSNVREDEGFEARSATGSWESGAGAGGA